MVSHSRIGQNGSVEKDGLDFSTFRRILRLDSTHRFHVLFTVSSSLSVLSSLLRNKSPWGKKNSSTLLPFRIEIKYRICPVIKMSN
jgi:hypothetical protein